MTRHLRSKLIALKYRLEYWQEVFAVWKYPRAFWEPVSTGTWIAIAISAALSAGSAVLNYVLMPKPKMQPKGKLSGDISISDSIWGAPVYRIYGRRGADNQGGVEVGTNIFFASDIRRIEIQTQGTAGGSSGGKGGRRNSGQRELRYKIDFAAAIGEGPLRLLRIKLNEDVVFENAYNLEAEPTGGTKMEAEAITNVLTLPAVVIENEPSFSSTKGVANIHNIGPAATIGESASVSGPGASSFVFNSTKSIIKESRVASGDGVAPLNATGALTFNVPGGPVGGPGHPHSDLYTIHIGYKADSDYTCEVFCCGETIPYTFPATQGERRWRTIFKSLPMAMNTFRLQNASSANLKIDALIIEDPFIYIEPENIPYRPTGQFDPQIGLPPVMDNYIFPERDTRHIENINRNNLPVFENPDGTILTTLTNGAELAFYPGNETQLPDTVIAAWVASQPGKTAAHTPAFRGIAYLRMKDLDFSKWGSFPNVKVVVENRATRTVEEILLVEAQKAGLQTNDLDFAVAADKKVRGYLIADAGAPEKVFNDLGLLYNLSYAERSDGKLAAIDKYTRLSVADVNREDLGAYSSEGEEAPPADDVKTVVPDESEMPKTLELQFFNPLAPSNYGTDRREHVFPFTDSVKKETTSINATLIPDEAERIVKRMNQERWLKNAPMRFAVTQKFAWLDPGDCINVEIEGQKKLVRIESKEGSVPGNFEISATAEDLYVSADGVNSIIAPPPGTVTVPSACIGTLMEIPLLYNEQTPGVYVAATPSGAGNWTGAALYRNRGNDWQRLAVFSRPCPMGRAVNALGDAPSGYVAGSFDTVNSVTIDFYNNFQPDTITADATLDGGNLYVIGYELCYIQTWTRDNNFPNRWTGSNIIRRGKNTSDTGHAVGDRVVFFTDAIRFVPIEPEEAGVARQWKFASDNEALENVSPVYFTWRGGRNTETSVPVVARSGAATNTSQLLSITNFTSAARFREIQVAVDSGFATYTEVRQGVDSATLGLPPNYTFTRSTNLTNAQQFWVRVRHSSNGYEFGGWSAVETFTCPDNNGNGGSGTGTGGYVPIVLTASYDGIETVDLTWTNDNGSGTFDLEMRFNMGAWFAFANPANPDRQYTDYQLPAYYSRTVHYRIKRSNRSDWSNTDSIYIPGDRGGWGDQ